MVLSHRNMCRSLRVCKLSANTPDDRLLAVLPFSFDYGFSQLSTAFFAGATVVLLEYLLPRDVIRAVEREKITGLAGVPPLWIQLADLPWPAGVDSHLRYMTNSGGAMPRATLRNCAERAAHAILPDVWADGSVPVHVSAADEAEQRPDSIGKAIPNAEILVLRPDGSCDANEPGELVHRGSLVALGYWNDAAKTAERFKPIQPRSSGWSCPNSPSGPEIRCAATNRVISTSSDAVTR